MSGYELEEKRSDNWEKGDILFSRKEKGSGCLWLDV